LLFFYLNSPELAVSRVKSRVKEGGHNIAEEVVRRRYASGLKNFFKLYLSIVDNWILINNSGDPFQIIAEGSFDEIDVQDNELWGRLKLEYNG